MIVKLFVTSLKKVSTDMGFSLRSLFTDCANTGHPRFFLGSDSAPHPPRNKSTSTPSCGCAAGIYTSPILLPLTAHILESFGALDRLEGFVGTFGRDFYKIPAIGSKVVLKRGVNGATFSIPEGGYTLKDESVVPFWAGKQINWTISK